MRVLNVANTVFELYYLSSVGYLLRHARPDISLRLVTTPHVAARLNQELEGLYSDVQVLGFPSISYRPAPDVVRSLRFRHRLGQLDLRADIVCISSFREYFANILCRYWANGPRLVALRMCDYECDRLCQARRPLRSVYLNLLNHLFGVSTMEYRWHSDTAFTYAYWYTRNPYHRTICISDWGHGQTGSEFRLPPPFVALRQLYGVGNDAGLRQEHAILVAGERTPLFETWDAAAQSLYDHIFDFLRQHFDGYRLLFKPRAGLTDSTHLRLDGFEMVPADMPFEELCLRNVYDRVISIKSTACKVAAYCGQPAYVLYKMFDLPTNLRQTLDAYLSDMQSIVKVRNLNELLHDPPVVHGISIDKLSRSYWQAVVAGAR